MIERGITMTGDNPALIMADLKTHSRRVIDRDPREWKFVGAGPGDPENFIFESRTEPGLRESETCPYGQKGDRLYVRETFAMRSDIDWRKQPAKALHYAHYKADRGTFDPKSGMNYHDWGRGRSPRFMPKCLARLRLEIVEPVRVERLQDITQRDAQAEGMHAWPLGSTPRRTYSVLWDRIHGAGEWERNPLVWVLIFKKL